MRVMAIAFALLLSGCAGAPKVQSQTERSVTYCVFKYSKPHPDELATAHCAARGKTPKEMVNGQECAYGVGTPGTLYSYECVTP